VALPLLTMCWPAEHCRLLEQNAEPFEPWNSSSPHAAQLAAFVVAVKEPAEHATQRSGVDSAALASCVPGLHGCFVSQYGWPALSWYLPSGHAVQLGEFAVPEKLPAAHGAQMRFELAVPAVSMLSPAAHEA